MKAVFRTEDPWTLLKREKRKTKGIRSGRRETAWISNQTEGRDCTRKKKETERKRKKKTLEGGHKVPERKMKV